MKRRWFVIALCVCVCAVMCAVCLMSSCTIIDDVANTLGIDLGGGSGSGSDDNSSGGGSAGEEISGREITDADITAFKTAMLDYVEYDGSYSAILPFIEDAGTNSSLYDYEIAYNASEGYYALQLTEYVDGVAYWNAERYATKADTDSTWTVYDYGMEYAGEYYKYTVSDEDMSYDLSQLMSLFFFTPADPSGISSANDLTRYLASALTPYYSTVDEYTMTLIVSDSNGGSTMFTVSGVNESSNATEDDNFTVSVTINNGKVYNISFNLNEKDYSYIADFVISYSFDDAIWPANFDAWAVEEEDENPDDDLDEDEEEVEDPDDDPDENEEENADGDDDPDDDTGEYSDVD